MKKQLFVFLFGIAVLLKLSCSEANQHVIPGTITDTIRLAPGEGADKDLLNDLERMRVHVEAYNYTDTPRTLVVTVREIGN